MPLALKSLSDAVSVLFYTATSVTQQEAPVFYHVMPRLGAVLIQMLCYTHIQPTRDKQGVWVLCLIEGNLGHCAMLLVVSEHNAVKLVADPL